MLLALVFFALLGSIVGSFLNVIVLRKGVASLSGRSHCPSCGKTIAAYDLFPVVSWIILRGRCRYCGSAISVQYPLVEAITGALFAAVGGAFYPEFIFSLSTTVALVLSLGIVGILVAITVYDFRHTIIPDEWVVIFGLLALLFALTNQNLPDTSFARSILAGFAAALPLFFLWLISRGAWMGLGDPKLALGIGWLLGFPHGVIAVFASFVLGSVMLVPIVLYQMAVTHTNTRSAGTTGLTMKSEVPFGPFLIASCIFFWFMQLYGVQIPLYLLGL